jgi:mercuric ion binding protein
MNLIQRSSLAALALCLASTSLVWAETKVVVSGVHLCCGGCVTGAQEAVEGLTGVKAECSMKEKSITITATDDAGAQKAIDALADSGFHGKVDSKTVAFKPVATPDGKVKRLEVSGVHNCCGSCNKAIKGAIKTVDGVSSDNASARSDAFVVEGDFSAKQLVDALLGAGFHVSVK